jgi:hypothetical protein
MVDRIKNMHEGETRRPQPAQTGSSTRSKIDPMPLDDLIVALANARENRRARQVTEWERLYQARRVST